MRVGNINRITAPTHNIMKNVAKASHEGALIAKRAAKQNHTNMLTSLFLKCYTIGKKVFQSVPGGPFTKACSVIGLFSPFPFAILAGFFVGNGMDYIRNKYKSKTS